MTIKARTEYTEAIVLKLVRSNLFKNPIMVAVYIILEYFMVSVSINAIRQAISEEWPVFLAAIFAVIFPLIIPCAILATPKFAAKKGNALGAVIAYEFSDQEIIIDAVTKTETTHIQIEYSLFKRVCETKDAFYLYIQRQQAYVVGKTDITEGSALDLRNLLMKNSAEAGYKYITKGMKKSEEDG